MRFEQIKCDRCGSLKKESNHWLVLWVSEEDKTFSNFDPRDSVLVTVSPGRQDFCSSQCLISEIFRLTCKDVVEKPNDN